MATNLSIRNAPDEVVRRLKERAARHHRSLQEELLAILAEAAREPHTLTAEQVVAEVRRLGLATPPESAAMLRRSRR